jgi:hypothetical protein
MSQITIRQLATLVEDQLLSHLSEQALEDYMALVKARQVPGAQVQFPTEVIDPKQISNLAGALNQERSIRVNTNVGI